MFFLTLPFRKHFISFNELHLTYEPGKTFGQELLGLGQPNLI